MPVAELLLRLERGSISSDVSRAGVGLIRPPPRPGSPLPSWLGSRVVAGWGGGEFGVVPGASLGFECRVRDVTVILDLVNRGDPQAADELLPLVYEELRKLAAAKMAREAPGQTLQATALVHEAWLRLGGEQQPEWQNRAHFFAAAAEAMRRILIDRARRRQAVRHGGELVRTHADALEQVPNAAGADDAELLDVHEALDALARHDARKAELVKQCYFVGLTFKEAALVLGISEPTARRDWIYARAWLFAEINRMRQAGR